MTTSRITSDEPTTPMAALVWGLVEATNARDLDAMVSFYAADAVFETMPEGLVAFEGRVAIRGFSDDWWGAYDEYRAEAEEIRDLGDGVGFVVVFVRGRLRGSTAWVQFRWGSVVTRIDGLIERTTNYFDIDEARAAAERLAEGESRRTGKSPSLTEIDHDER
jgi:ketosteroid isomerase-like protein